MKKMIIILILFSTSCEKINNIFIDGDGVNNPVYLNNRMTGKYYDYYSSKYTEYSKVYCWFESNPDELENFEGDFYKIISSEILDGKDIIRKNYERPTNKNFYKYFYKTEDYYLIIEIKIDNDEVICSGIRRIKDGMGKNPMYDLIHNQKKDLIKEIFLSEVSSDFYTKKNNVYFEFSKEFKDKNIVNTLNLGKSYDY